MDKKEWDKVSKNYFKGVQVSPFAKNVINPLLKDIKKLKKNNSVIDLGTGTGNLLPYLKKFKTVYATDFSKGMVDEAKKNNQHATLLVKDSKDLKGLPKFDITFAINSVLDPSIKNTQLIFQQIAKITKKQFYGIFPALESELFRALLTVEKELKTNKEATAIKNTHDIMRTKEFDYVLAIYKDGKQKTFYKFEIEHYLKQNGFTDIEFQKVLYPWSTWDVDDINYFKSKPKLWDWYVKAKKKKLR